MSHTKLLNNDSFEGKISGMNVDFAKILRKNKTEKEFFKKISKKIKTIIAVDGAKIGVAFCSPFKDLIKDFNSSDGFVYDAYICFLSDYSNIDSKQMTFIKKKGKIDASSSSKVWKKLYKINYSE